MRKLFARPWGRSLMREFARIHFMQKEYVQRVLDSMALTTCAPADLDRIAELIGVPR